MQTNSKIITLKIQKSCFEWKDTNLWPQPSTLQTL